MDDFRIALLIDQWKSSAGGIQTVNRMLACSLSKIGQKILVIAKRSEKEEIEDANKHGVILKPSGDTYLSAHKILKDFQPNVICGHAKFTGPLAMEMMTECPSAIRVQFLHFDPETIEGLKEIDGQQVAIKRQERSQIEIDCAKGADLVLAIGETLRDLYVSRIQAACIEDGKTLPTIGFLNVGMTDHKEAQPNKTGNLEVLMLGRTESVHLQ